MLLLAQLATAFLLASAIGQAPPAPAAAPPATAPRADAAGWQLVAAPWHHAATDGVAISEDAKTVVSLSQDGSWKVWALGDEAPRCSGALPVVAERYPKRQVAVGGAGERLAIWTQGDGLRLGSTKDCELGAPVAGVCATVSALVFAPAKGGERLAVACDDGGAEIWTMETGGTGAKGAAPKRQHRLALGERPVDVAWAPDGSSLLVATTDGEFGTLSLWDGATGERKRMLSLATPEGPADPSEYLVTPNRVGFSADGTLAFSAGWLVATVWDVATGLRMASFRWGEQTSGFGFVPLAIDAERRLWVFTDDGLLRWDLGAPGALKNPDWRTRVERRPDEGFPVPRTAALSYGIGANTAGTAAVAGALDGGVHRFALPEGKRTALGDRPAGRPEDAAFLDDRRLLVAFDDGAAEVRTLPDLKPDRRLQLIDDDFRCFAIAPQRDRVAVGSSDYEHVGAVRVAAIGAGAATGGAGAAAGGGPPLVRRAKDAPADLAWSPDGKTLAIGWTSGDVALVPAGGAESAGEAGAGAARTLGRHEQAVTGVAWSPDGRLLASVGEDGLVRIWQPDGAGDGPLRTLTPATRAPLTSVAWSPDGQTVFAGQAFLGSDLPGVAVWDARTGEPRQALDAVHDVSSLQTVERGGRTLLLAGSLESANAGVLLDPATGRVVARFPSVDGYGWHVALAPGGDAVVLVTTGQERTFRVWVRKDAGQAPAP